MSITETAREFFEACETGRGWAECAQYCHDGATFSCQADALAEIGTLEGYTDWMRDLLTPIPDGRYELKSFAVDEELERAHVLVADRNIISYVSTCRGPSCKSTVIWNATDSILI